MCSPIDVYRIHWGSEIAHWKNLSVGHQACFHWAGSHSVRLAAPDKLRAALKGFKGCLCVRLLHLPGGPGRGLAGGDGLTASASEQGKGLQCCPATCPRERAGLGSGGEEPAAEASQVGGGKLETRCEERAARARSGHCRAP